MCTVLIHAFKALLCLLSAHAAANLVGMVLGGLSAPPMGPLQHRDRLLYIGIIVTNCASGILVSTGLSHIGSGLFVIVYSSTIVWTSLFAMLLLNRPLSAGKWAGVLLIFLGLCASCWGLSASGENLVFGVACVLSGSVLHAADLALSEALLHSPTVKIAPRSLSYELGRIQLAMMLAWYGVLGLHDAFLQGPDAPARRIDVSWLLSTQFIVAVAMYAFLVLLNAVKAVAFFDMMGSVGSVASAVMKGVQTVLTYVFSAVLFCKYQQSQCFTVPKGVSVVVVLCGTLLYGLSPAAPSLAPASPKKAVATTAHKSSTVIPGTPVGAGTGDKAKAE